MPKVALGLDLRDVSYAKLWPDMRKHIETAGHNLTVVFVDAADSVLLRRFSETRRTHPLGQGHDLIEAVELERKALGPLKKKAEFVVDTTGMSVHDLKRRIGDLISGRSQSLGMSITIKSFGYKHGPATDADLLFDVRFLPNPYFEEELKSKTGLDAEVAEYVLERDETRAFLSHFDSMLEFLLPRYAREGRAYLTIGIGCTGGRHRSVAIAERLLSNLVSSGENAIVRHRDVEK